MIAEQGPEKRGEGRGAFPPSPPDIELPLQRFNLVTVCSHQ